MWGADRADLAAARRALGEGLDLGAIRLVPADVLSFVAIFAAGWMLTRLAQRVLGASVLSHVAVNPGARVALVSLLGNLGVTLSALVAISAVGLDLTNLALVAGALSVGVGFGLQGFVNNFISGVILQIEQPFKVGDWIEVNGVHGTVRRINVRSTLIETFDRAAYVMPNADLVSQPVTNFTRRNRIGRVIVRVRTPFESDPADVERLLLEVYAAAPNTRRWPGTGVFLMALGPSGYEFELRVILRDVTTFVAATSAIRLDIAARFRAAGVSFAVERRDVRLVPADAPVDGGARADDS